MAHCRECKKSLPKGAKFCGHCGAKAVILCPSCGATDLPGPNFCVKCGANLRTGAKPRDPEEAIEDELKIYKAGWTEGYQVVTCVQCGAKNRIPKTKMERGPSCGRCKAPLSLG